MSGKKDATSVAEAEYDEDFQCKETEKELQELLKFNIYGEQTTLDGIIEAAKKNINETKARVAEFKTLFEQSEGGKHLGIVPGSSTPVEILVGSTEINMEDENISRNKDATSVNDSLHEFSGKMNDTVYKDFDLSNIEKNDSYPMIGTIKKPSKKTTLDAALPTLEASHHDDVGSEPKPVISNEITGTPMRLVHVDAKTTFDISLPTLDELDTVACNEVVKNELSDVEVWNDGCPLPSSGPTCSDCQNIDDGHSSRTEAISTQVSTAGCLPECEEPRSGCVNIESVMSSEQVSHLPTSINEDGANISGKEGFSQFQNNVEGWKHLGLVPDSSTSNQLLAAGTEVDLEDENMSGNKDAPSVNDSLHEFASEMSDTVFKDEKNNSYAMLGIIKESANESILDVSLPTLEASQHDDIRTNTATTLVHGDTKSRGGELDTVVENKLRDVEVWNDGCPLPSSGHICSDCQNIDDLHSLRAEVISTQVSTAGCLPECEEPRSGCVNIESVMSSEQVGHLPTIINEDGANISGKEGFPQFQNNVEGKSNEFDGIIRRSKLQKPNISLPYQSLPDYTALRCCFCSEVAAGSRLTE